MSFIVVNDAHKQVHDLLFNVGSESHEFSIHAMQNGLQVVTFPGIFWIEKLKEAVDEIICDMSSQNIILEVHSQDEF